MSHFEEEGFYYFGVHNTCELLDQYRDRFLDDIEKHRPDIYEILKSHLANKEIEEFLSTPRKRDDDYYND